MEEQKEPDRVLPEWAETLLGFILLVAVGYIVAGICLSFIYDYSLPFVGWAVATIGGLLIIGIFTYPFKSKRQ